MRKIISFLMVVVLCLAVFVGCGTGVNSESLDELIALGAQYLIDGNYSEAVVAFDKAIKIDNKSIVAYVGLGDGNLGLEDYDKAGEAYEKAIAVGDQTIEAYIGRADAYLFEENTESAVAILNKGYEATGNAELSSIVEEINAGTYEPSVLHMVWETIAEISNTATDNTKKLATDNKEDSVKLLPEIPSKAIIYFYGPYKEVLDGEETEVWHYMIEYYNATDMVIGGANFNPDGSIDYFESKRPELDNITGETTVFFDDHGYAESSSESISYSWSAGGKALAVKDYSQTDITFYNDGSVKNAIWDSDDWSRDESYEKGEEYCIYNIGEHMRIDASYIL